MNDPRSVLIVDDEKLIRLNLGILLEDLGFSVLEAANGQEALDVFDRERPDLVLTDLRMPRMDGLALISALTKKSPDTPTIVVSGIGKIQEAIEAIRRGAWDYITKPVEDQDSFEILIERVLERARLIDENRRYREHLEEQIGERTVELETSNRVLQEEISERKQAEQQLELLNYALDNVNEGAFLIDEQKRFTYVNQEACRSVEYSRDELLGMTVLDIDAFFTPELAAKHLAVLDRQGTLTFETQHRTKSDRIFPVEITTSVFEHGGSRYYLSLVRNIAERKRAEDTLRFITQRNWLVDTDNFLTSLAQRLGESLGMEYVLIDRLCEDDPSIAETAALYAKGSLLPAMRYPLKDTPCDNVMAKAICVYPRNVQALFPADPLLVEMGVESYAGIPLWDSTGRPIGLIAVLGEKPLRDEVEVIHILQLVATSAAAALERERSDNLLIRREREFRTLAENSPDSILRYDAVCSCIYANPRIEKILAIPAGGMHGKTPMERFPAGEYREYQNRIEEVLRTGRNAELEVVLPDTGEGVQYHHIRFTAEFSEQGNVTGVLVIGRDITERKRTEQVLKKQEQEFRTLAENSPDNIVRYDTRCRAIYINPRMEKTLGRPASYILDKTPVEKSGESLREYQERIERVIATGEEADIDLTMPCGEGKCHHNIRFVAERDLNGTITGVLAIGRDITERIESEERLREKQERLNAMALELSLTEERERRAIATELHDQIGQDLTLVKIKLGVLAKATVMENAVPVLKGVREILNGVIRHVRALTHRISPPILESGSLELALKWLARQMEEDYGLQIRFIGDTSDKPLTDETRSVLYHAVRELLVNVAKHANAITVTVTVARKNDSFLLVVADDGIGFDSSGIIENGGVESGFGLFNVRRRILYLGGTFEAESSPGKGAAVTIVMPLAKDEE